MKRPLPITLDAGRTVVYLGTPLRSHTDEVLATLGYSAKEPAHFHDVRAFC